MSNRLRLGAACAVLALHLPLLLERHHAPRAQPPGPAMKAPLTVWIMPPSPARNAFDGRQPAASTERRGGSLARPAAPSTGTAREPATEAIGSPPAVPAPTQGIASAPGPGPEVLDLSLPPRALRGEAVTPPGPPARPRSVEASLARALGETPLIQENLGDGRLRLRRGRDCVELRDARMAQLDPFNQSVSPIPKQAEGCRH